MARTKGSKNKPKAEVKTAKKAQTAFKNINKVNSQTLATLYLMSKDRRSLTNRINRLYFYVAALALVTAFATLSIVINK